jgi:hypothetical protein
MARVLPQTCRNRSHASVRASMAAVLFVACGLPAAAHDSWLRLSATQPATDLLVLELYGGARYPKSEGPTPADRLAQAGCAGAHGTFALVPRTEHPVSLELRARASRLAPLACWVELKPQPITLEPALVQTYFDDIRAPAAVRQAWARLQADGVGWSEVYRKFIRIELPQPDMTQADLAALRRPMNLPLELVPAGAEPLRRGVEGEYLALAEGKPVEGLPVEFVSTRSPLGIWRQTDRDGRVRFTAPFTGEWLLRGTVLEVPAAPGHVWHSRFATLTVWMQ